MLLVHHSKNCKLFPKLDCFHVVSFFCSNSQSVPPSPGVLYGAGYSAVPLCGQTHGCSWHWSACSYMSETRNDKPTAKYLQVYHTSYDHSLKRSVIYSAYTALVHCTHIMCVKSACPRSEQHHAPVGRISHYIEHAVLVITRWIWQLKLQV